MFVMPCMRGLAGCSVNVLYCVVSMCLHLYNCIMLLVQPLSSRHDNKLHH